MSPLLFTSALLATILLQHPAWAHGGEDHGRTATPSSQETPQTTPLQLESPQNSSTQPAQTASDVPSSAGIAPEADAATTKQNNLLVQIPALGLSESLFGLILIAPFGLARLRHRVQNTRKSLNQSAQ